MKQRSIEILINADGGIAIDAVGFTGPDCEAATRFLEEALGRTESRRRKPEYHRKAIRQNMGRQSIGGSEP